MSWKSRKQGNGSVELTEVSPPNSLAFNYFFHKSRFKMKGQITLQQTGETTIIIYKLEGTVGWRLLRRYFAIAMPALLKAEIDKSLQKLKALCER